MPVPCSGGREVVNQASLFPVQLLSKTGMLATRRYSSATERTRSRPLLDRRSQGRSPVHCAAERAVDVVHFSLPGIAWQRLTENGQVLWESLSVPKAEVH
jgi:hypothetical protein